MKEILFVLSLFVVGCGGGVAEKGGLNDDLAVDTVGMSHTSAMQKGIAPSPSPEERGVDATNNGCEDVPEKPASYAVVTEWIRNTDFKMEERLDTPESSFVRYGEYYSCDGRTGFFVVKLKDREYLYDDMPLALWVGFKNADSKGEYYRENIRGKYGMGLGN